MTGSMAVSSMVTVPVVRDREGLAAEWWEVESRFIHALVAGEDPRQAVEAVLTHLYRRWRTPIFLLLEGGRWIACEGVGATVCRSILQRLASRGWGVLQRLYQDPSWQELDEAPCLSGLWAGLVESLGDPRLDSVWGVPVRDREGRLVGLLGQCLPRSLWHDQERRRALAQVARSLGYLASRVPRHVEDRGTREFVAWLAVSAQALRSPLNALLGYGDLLLEELQGDGARAEDVRQMRHAGRRLAGMLQDVLDFAQCASGRLRPHSRLFEAEVLFRALTSRPVETSDGVTGGGWSLQWQAAGEWRQDADLLRRLLQVLLAEVERDHSGERLCLEVRDLSEGWVEVSMETPVRPVERAYWREVARGGVPLPGEEAVRRLELGWPLAWRLARLLGGELLVEAQRVVLRLPRCFPGDETAV